ncbi:MAG: (d)CMP kinase [Phycisphaerales bacterium]|nr:MAG: (d)CMP kinase [Phycisphaerales bacterium]
MADLVITIDGPAASGKSTVARLLADRLGVSLLDTGAMYRAVTLAAMEAGIDITDEDDLLEVLETRRFEFSVVQGVTEAYVDGVDVTDRIRDPEVTAKARHIASARRVRERLVEMQRRLAGGRKKIVTEGRDQGTVAFSDADVKFYLTADAGERARRRQADLRAKGIDESVEQVQRTIESRDRSDERRAAGPLKPAPDAIIIDTTNLGIEEVVEKVLGIVRERCSEKL